MKLARVGLTLEQNVLDQAGRLIIAKGTRLTPMLLSRLQKWNIPEIYVPTDEAAAILAQEAGEDAETSGASVLVPAGAADGRPSDSAAANAAGARPAARRPSTRITVMDQALSEEAIRLAYAVEQELNDCFAYVIDRPLMRILREAAWNQLTQPGVINRIPGRK